MKKTDIVNIIKEEIESALDELAKPPAFVADFGTFDKLKKFIKKAPKISIGFSPVGDGKIELSIHPGLKNRLEKEIKKFGGKIIMKDKFYKGK